MCAGALVLNLGSETYLLPVDLICSKMLVGLLVKSLTKSSTQTKPYNTLPPFEQRDSWSSYGAVRTYSEVVL